MANEGGALTLGGISQCPSYLSQKPKADVQAEYKKQIDVFVSEGMDFLLCEVRLCKTTSRPVLIHSLLVL